MSLSIEGFRDAMQRGGKGPVVHPVWANSILDPGSPQYIVPEDTLLDICAQRFCKLGSGVVVGRGADQPRSLPQGLTEYLGKFHHNPPLTLAAGRKPEEFVEAVCLMVAVPGQAKRRTGSHYPVSPKMIYFSWIRANAPNLFTSQLAPALEAAGKAHLVANLDRALLGDAGRRAPDVLEVLFDRISEAAGKSPLKAAPFTPSDGFWLRRTRGAPPGDGRLTPPERLAADLEILCDYEPSLPRLDWTEWMCAFVRTYLPLVFLWRTRAAVLVSQECRRILRREPRHLTAADALHDGLLGLRPEDGALLKATDAWINQIEARIREYAEARLEVNTLLWMLSVVARVKLAGRTPKNSGLDDNELEDMFETKGGPYTRRISMPFDTNPDGWPCDDFLRTVEAERASLDAFAQQYGLASAADFIRIVIDAFPKYLNIRKGTWGNNMSEYVRYSLRSPGRGATADRYSLIRTWGGGRVRQGVRIEPAPGLLNMVAQLANSHATRVSEKATIGDVLDIFADLRVEFPPGDGGLTLLLDRLAAEGLLQGSPDAMTAALVGRPFSHV